MPFCKNHSHLYFDNLRRTQKAETLNCLIHASNQANSKALKKEERKEVIAKLLKHAYDLYGVKANSYVGDVDQFDSQYTIGHELAIWTNSYLELNELAKKVAAYEITIKEYFDIVFLNYIQPIDNQICHPLYSIAKYAVDNNLSEISKDDMKNVFSWVSNSNNNNINGLYNMLLGTSYFKVVDDRTLSFTCEPRELRDCCNIEYLSKSVEEVNDALGDVGSYVSYMIRDHRSVAIIKNLQVHNRSNKQCVKNPNLVGYNKIFYGIPGCGKSYHVEHNILKNVDKQKNVFRTTFYLDYSNSDFIGQIYPKVVGTDVTYENVPGPFTKALKRAFEEPNSMIYLIIEEINRGNAAAIFGDTFQLLDRLKMNHDGRIPGDSEYPISNEFIESYLGDLVVKGQVYIPNNLTILATMNTSDQNVFPLDTAFKRRWDMEKVVTNWSECDLADLCVPFTDFTWEQFAKTINVRMIKANETGDVIISEDKKLGAYFVTKDMLVEKSKRHDDTPENRAKLKKFVTNVVDYLFNDVTKFDHSALFRENITFDDIYDQITNFELSDREVDVFHNVFKENVEPNVTGDE